MIRRDRHTMFVLCGMLSLNILTALVCVLCCVSFRKKIVLHAATSIASCKQSEKASIDASANVLLLVDMVKEGQCYVSSDGAPAPQPKIVGFGQTRSRNAVYIYRDVEVEGVVHREFIERIPFSDLSLATSP